MKRFLLVRHADIDLPPTSSDPSLNAAGRARALALARLAGTASSAAISLQALDAQQHQCLLQPHAWAFSPWTPAGGLVGPTGCQVRTHDLVLMLRSQRYDSSDDGHHGGTRQPLPT